MSAARLYIVVPCYNEEEVLPETGRRLHEVLLAMVRDGAVSPDSRVTLVDDGSRDGTWRVIEALMEAYPEVEGIKLAHNAGHQNALWAGMSTVKDKCDCVITIDADLQDDVNAIPRFIEQFAQGCQVVYGVRSARESDTAFKRGTAHLYYRLMKRMGVDLEYDHADYRLLGRDAVRALASFEERNLFLRGMVPLLGFKQGRVSYERAKRFAGESKYPLGKMIAFAMEGITSFSVKPIRLVVAAGVVFALLGVVMALWAIIRKLTGGADASGWASLMVSLWLIGGVQLIALGLIGEYVGKIYTEVKRRPRFIIERYATRDAKDRHDETE